MISYIGYLVKKSYQNRRDFYLELLGFYDYVIMEVDSISTPLLTIIDNYKKENEKSIIMPIFERGKSSEKKEISKSKMSKIISQSLSRFSLDDDIKCAKVNVMSIGKYDKRNELDKLKNIRANVEIKKNSAVEKYNKEGVMAFNLAVLFGLVVMILIV